MCHWEKVEGVSLLLIWVIIFRAIRGVLVGDGGVVSGLWVVVAVGIEFSSNEGSPNNTIMKFEIMLDMLLL